MSMIQTVHELTGLVGEANNLLATSTQLETKYLALPSYAERRNSTQLLEDAHVRLSGLSCQEYLFYKVHGRECATVYHVY